VDAVFFEDLGGFDAFPGGGDFDEHAVAADAGFFVEGDDLAGFGDGGGGVEGEPGVHFGGDAAGDDFEDFETENDEEAVDDGGQRGGGAGVGDGLVEERGVGGHRGGFEDEGRVGGRVAGGEFLHGGEVAGVGDDDGELLQLVELGGHGIGKEWETLKGGRGLCHGRGGEGGCK
jgi:hypothetical protein